MDDEYEKDNMNLVDLNLHVVRLMVLRQTVEHVLDLDCLMHWSAMVIRKYQYEYHQMSEN